MPFVRYETGDEATLVHRATPENNFALRLHNIVPRQSQEFLVTKSNDLVHFGCLLMGEDIVALNDFQLVQQTPGQVQLKAVADLARGAEVLDFARRVRARTHGQIEIVPEIVSSTPLTARGKRPLIYRIDTRAFEHAAGIPSRDARW